MTPSFEKLARKAAEKEFGNEQVPAMERFRYVRGFRAGYEHGEKEREELKREIRHDIEVCEHYAGVEKLLRAQVEKLTAERDKR